jgi:hypothetical protein
MTANYFRNFGTVGYRFGDGETISFFKNITQNVTVLEAARNNATSYNLYTVMSGERPDTLSYKLYGTVDYYWTFYIVNEHLRESGWPIPSYDLLDEAKSKYPYRTVTTNDDVTSFSGDSERFAVGQTVSGNSSSTIGTIVRKIPEMGQLIINTGTIPNTNKFNESENISYRDIDGNTQSATLVRESSQYDSVHHYEDSDGEWQDFTIGSYPQSFNSVDASWIPVTHLDRIVTKNEELKEIVIIKPSMIRGISLEFQKLMKQRF